MAHSTGAAMDTAGLDPPPRRRRVERGKRSKNGCRTCISKRVKCDELRPECGRCVRLRLPCEWAPQPPSLALRRRGQGPIKARDDGWAPGAILPKPVDGGGGEEEEKGEEDKGKGKGKEKDTGDALVPLLNTGDGDGDDVTAAASDHLDADFFGLDQELAGQGLAGQVLSNQALSTDTQVLNSQLLNSQFLGGPDTLNINLETALISQGYALTEGITPLISTEPFPSDTATLGDSDDWIVDLTHQHQQHQYQQHQLQLQQLYNLQFPSSLPFNPFNSANYPSASTPLFFTSPIDDMSSFHAPSTGTSDMQAVSFHRVVFAPLKSARTPAVSAHALFLSRALENRMALHFLLALSHSELAVHQGIGLDTPREAWTHYQRGSRLFLQALDPQDPLAQPDHVAMMLSFLYMYMFWMRRSPLNVPKLRELSQSVLAYVKRYDLDELCASASMSASAHASTSDQVLIARILTYLYDRDGFCGFFGGGGVFASYVSQNHDKRHRIWRLSRTTFPGADEVPTAVGLTQMPKMQDLTVLGVYFDLIALHHDVNNYSQAPEDQALAAKVKIKRSLDRIQQEQPFISNLVAESERQGSSPFLMALVTVTFFHALQIYFYRARNSCFGQRPVPAEVQWALRELVAAAYYTMATGPVQLLERFQWSLLIAGVETHDPVHQEWIYRAISDPSMRHALYLVQEAQGVAYVSMQTMRQIIERSSQASTYVG